MGPTGMATRPEQLYEDDFYAWTREQARALRRLAESRPNVGLDLKHLIEEVSDLGVSQRDAVRSQVRRITEHCLKLEYSPARDPRAGWHEVIIAARIELEDKLTPTLRRDLQRRLPRLYDQARCAATVPFAFTGSLRLPPLYRRPAPTAWPTCCITTGHQRAGTALSRDHAVAVAPA